jgi:hypothetical protein
MIQRQVDEARKLAPGIIGKLGINALRQLDFTLWPCNGAASITGEKPCGETVPFRWSEGRITLEAVMGQESLQLVLDSGTDHVILFRLPAGMKNLAPLSDTMRTMERARSIVPAHWTGRLSLAERLHFDTLPAAVVVNGHVQFDGLLPVAPFKAIHIDQARFELVVQR